MSRTTPELGNWADDDSPFLEAVSKKTDDKKQSEDCQKELELLEELVKDIDINLVDQDLEKRSANRDNRGHDNFFGEEPEIKRLVLQNVSFQPLMTQVSRGSTKI